MEQRGEKMLSLPYFFLCSSTVRFSRSSADFITPAGTGKQPLGDCCFIARLQMNQHGGNPENKVTFLLSPGPSRFTPWQISICCPNGYLFGLLWYRAFFDDALRVEVLLVISSNLHLVTYFSLLKCSYETRLSTAHPKKPLEIKFPQVSNPLVCQDVTQILPLWPLMEDTITSTGKTLAINSVPVLGTFLVFKSEILIF